VVVLAHCILKGILILFIFGEMYYKAFMFWLEGVLSDPRLILISTF